MIYTTIRRSSKFGSKWRRSDEHRWNKVTSSTLTMSTMFQKIVTSSLLDDGAQSPKNCNPPLQKSFENSNVAPRETIRTLFWDNYFTGIRTKCYYFNTLFTKPNGSPSKGNPYNKQPCCYLLNSCFVVNFKSEQINCAYLITDQRKLSLFSANF